MEERLIKHDAKKKILVLASTFPRWKNDTTPPFVFELEKRLADDFHIFILAPHYKGAKKFERTSHMDIHRFSYFQPASWQKLCYDGGILPNLKKNKLLYIQAVTLILFESIAAVNLIKKENIRLVHAHWIIPQGIVALFLKKLFGVPYIVTAHGGDIYGTQNPITQRLKKKVLKNAEKITVVSNAIKEEIIQTIDPDLAVEVISMGVDSRLFNPDKYDEKIKKQYNIHGPFLLFVGRLAEKKGVRYLLQAMPEIIKRFPNVMLLIIGEGTMQKQLKDLAIDLGIEKNVLFLGPVPNHELPKYYATADIFIGPSIKTKDGDTEGLGLTFVEASFSGCIPIGSNIGGISDVIKNKETGFLVPEKDAKAIADSVLHILQNRKLMEKMKHDTRLATIKQFDWNIVAGKYKQIYIKSAINFSITKTVNN